MSSTPEAAASACEGIAQVGDIQLAYETHGQAGNPAVLLIMGFNMTLLAWPEAFIQALVQRGMFVVTFDNRDAGKSSRLASTNLTPLPMLTLARMSGIRLKTPYTLDDMANDAVGVLDHLNVQSAHVIGVSMGGMIAQLMALNHPERVQSLGLLMTHPGAVTYSIPSPKLGSLLLQQPGNDEGTQLAFNLKFWNMVCGPSYPPDKAEIRRLTHAISQRSVEPHGRERQMAAIIAAPDRSTQLKSLNIPTAVLHGTHDPLIIPRGGKTLARLIPGARLKMVEGMGHILPPSLCESMVAFLTNDEPMATSSAA
ncbi:MAG: alpha/beta fold hydrolase [Lysobacterales bacterium]